jgi:WhiB family redox-sensing transcriptional regulator
LVRHPELHRTSKLSESETIMSLILTPDTLASDALDATLTAGSAAIGWVHITGSLVLPDTDDDHEPALSSSARCADGNGTLSFLFFSEDDLELARAQAVCRTCGLHDECLSGAIEREEPYGVWGGKLVLGGVPVEFKRKRGRPPKTPTPILVVEEAPLPPHLVA